MIVLMTVDKEKNDVMNYAKNKTEIIVRSRKKEAIKGTSKIVSCLSCYPFLLTIIEELNNRIASNQILFLIKPNA